MIILKGFTNSLLVLTNSSFTSSSLVLTDSLLVITGSLLIGWSLIDSSLVYFNLKYKI